MATRSVEPHGWLFPCAVCPNPTLSPSRPRSARWRVLPAGAGILLAPAVARAAGMASAATAGPEWVVVVALVLAAGAGAWLAGRRGGRRAARDARQLSSVLEFADGLLWQAEVELETWTWTVSVKQTGLSRRLFPHMAEGLTPVLWPPDLAPDLKEMDTRCREALEAGRPGYEQQFRFLKDGKTYWLRESVSITRLETGRYSLVGLVTDVTAQREMETARRASEDQLRQLLDHADCLLWQARVTADEAGEFHWKVFAPPSELYRRIGGEKLVGAQRPWDNVLVPEYAQLEARCRQAMQAGEADFEQEFRAMLGSGVLWLREQVTVQRLGPREWMLEGVVTDITAQRRAEEHRLASEAELQRVINAADFLLWHARVIRRDTGQLQWRLHVPGSTLYRQLFGRDPDEPAGLAWGKLVTPETFDDMMRRCEEAIRNDWKGYEQEFRARGGNRAFWLHEHATIQRIGDDEWQLVGVVTDVTKRHEAEVAHQASERALREIVARADCLVWEGRVELRPDDDWNWEFRIQPSGLCELLYGVPVPPKEAGLWRLFDIPEREEMNRRCEEALVSGQPGYDQVFHIVRGDEEIWLHENVSIERTGANRYSLVGVVTDITAQHEAEAARLASEGALREILERANCLIWRAQVVQRDGTLHWMNFELPASRLSEDILGHKPATHEIQLWDEVHVPELPEMNARSHQALITGSSGYEQEFRAVRAGRRFWLHEQVSIQPVGEAEWRLVGVVTDVTERHEAREAQRRSEARLEELLERADCLIWQGQAVLQPDGELRWDLYVPRSRLFRRIFGDNTERASFHWEALGVPEFAEMRARARAAILGGLPGYEQQFHIPRAEGDLWVTEQVTVSLGGTDRWDVVGVITDVTARHEAEEARRRTEARLQQILELADCMVWEATAVERTDGPIDWDLYTPRSVLYRRLFGADTGDDARMTLDWDRLDVPETAEMARRAEQAIRRRAPGYEQEFRVIQPSPQRVIWLREIVTITPVAPNRVRLVGVITDITMQREAQEAHKASEAQVEQMLATVDCLLWQARVFEVGPDELRWVMFIPKSRLYRDIFGADPGTPPYLRWEGVLDKATEKEIDARAARHLHAGTAGYEQEFRAERGGRVFWLHEQVSIAPVGPKEWKLVGVITDLAARRAAEQAMRDSEERYRTLFQHTPVAIVEMDFTAVGRWLDEVRAKGVSDFAAWLDEDLRRVHHSAGLARFLDCNASAVAMFRARSKRDFRWRRGSLVTRDSLRTVRSVMLALWEGRNSHESEIQMRDFSGGLHEMHVRWWMERSERGLDYKQAVLVFVDFTELKKAEAALAAEKERLAVTLRAMAEGVVTTDVAGLIQYLNPAAAKFVGCEAAQVIGRPVTEICRFENDRTGEPVDVPVERVSLGDVVIDLPPATRLMAADHSARLVEGCCAPIHAADSAVIGTVLVFRDVTEHERLEQELERASKLESVGILAGGIAHDFNNILTAVMGNVALALLDIDPASEAGRSLREAEKATLRARDLTQQLLTFAKGGEPIRASVQLDGIVREMTTFTLHGSRVRAEYDLPEDLWPADADKGQIGRVVQNLVINAVQAMPEGGTVKVAMRNERIDGLSRPVLPPGNYVQIAISDTGVGIKPEHLSRIFDPYFTTKQMGSGLGLAAVYSIVHKHGGGIDVESHLGSGTTFRIWLPASRSAPMATEGGKRTAKAGAMKGRVLFMDDEEAIRHMAAYLLKRFGFEVVCTADGAETVRRFREAHEAGEPFALVIMDLTVPGGIGGREAIVQLRAIDPKVRAIVSSGYSSDPVLANYREHGFCGVAAKPYEVNEFARVLREALADNAGGSRPSVS